MCTLMMCGHHHEKRETESVPDKCKPGTSKVIDCNICNCAAVGVWACTLKSCDGGDDSAILRSRRAVEEVKEVTIQSLATTPCTPGQETRLDCNTCKCASDGTGYFCTRQACAPVHHHKRSAEEVKEVTTTSLATTPCTPGEKTQIDCNTCTCARDGSGYACTRKMCLPATHDRRRREAETEEVKEVTTDTLATTPCKAGEQRQVDCNTCTCAADGTGYQCTRQACEFAVHDRKRREAKEEEIKEATAETLATTPCTPGEKAQVDCNICTCSANGTGFACTRKSCPVSTTTTHSRKRRSDDELETEKLREKECTPGENKHDGCNTCFCGPTGHWACSLKACINLADLQKTRTKREEDDEKVDKEEKKCTPGETKHDGCNTCFCGPTGSYACSRKACGVPPKPDSETRTKRQAEEPKKECTPGETTHDGCNSCFCTESGVYACTLKACLGPLKNFNQETRTKREDSEPECTQGEVKQVDCNTCRCANGVFACTRKMCLPEDKAPRTRRQAGTCVPGSTKKEDCNTCTCNEKGTAYRCTLLACGGEHIRIERDTPSNLPSTRCEPNSVFKQDCNTCRCNAQGTFAACTFKLCIPGQN
ncbi:laminin subunit alpha-like [Ctenocephalides felis]|uniref:laminin subunit alpha-like n=1 Tax=Ctenocephalides felis TaxID=7515 RepID=UPI000E6E4419|nr:laminin subunit alpha-like [Ctenocephalides felis]